MSRFHVNLPQTQIKKMTKDEVEDRLREAALEQIEKRDCAGLVKYLEPLYAEGELANWARSKFDIQIDPKELVMEDARSRRPADEISDMIITRARAAYARREIEYPVDHTLTFAFGNEEGATTDNPYAADFVRAWARSRFGADLSIDHIRSQSIRLLRDELIGLQEKAVGDGGVEAEVDAIMKANSTPQQLTQAVNDRYSTRFQTADFDPEQAALVRDDEEPALPPRELLLRTARNFYRKELTDLEQFVLIQIFDQSWKDHLYAMDMLRSGIGLQAFAEKDPRILYKKEGFRFFQEMMSGVRDKVTDLIFRARVVRETQSRSAYRETAAVHEDAGGYGVGENVQRTSAELSAGVPAEPAASSGAEEGPVAVKQIVNAAPKVGRNDLCPCGSGKKYKKCHGANAA